MRYVMTFDVPLDFLIKMQVRKKRAQQDNHTCNGYNQQCDVKRARKYDFSGIHYLETGENNLCINSIALNK